MNKMERLMLETYMVALPIILTALMGYAVWLLKRQKRDRDANSRGTMLLLRVQLIDYHDKYMALGDLVIFIAYAILPTLGTSYAATGSVMWDSLWLAPPVGLITVAILHANNARDTATDRRAQIRTFAMSVGQLASRAIYYAEILIPFAWIAVCCAAGVFPLWSLLVMAALFPAAAGIRTMGRSKKEGMSAIRSLDEATARLQMVFSLLFTISFILASFI